MSKVLLTEHQGKKGLTMSKESGLVLTNQIAPFWTQNFDPFSSPDKAKVWDKIAKDGDFRVYSCVAYNVTCSFDTCFYNVAIIVLNRDRPNILLCLGVAFFTFCNGLQKFQSCDILNF